MLCVKHAMDQTHEKSYRTNRFLWGFPGWSGGKEPTCNAGNMRHRFDPWVGKIPPEEEMATHSCILAWRISWRSLVG